MDRIGVVGTSYRTAQVDELAAAALPANFEHAQLVELARLAGFSELVYLGTCNRVEFYFRGETRIHTNPLLFHLRRSLADLTDGSTQLPDDDRLYVHFGRSAVRHLFRVASALDSMMVGEAQITGQAKEAHERAHRINLLGGILDQTFHEAFHLAKRIRTETELTRRPVSLVTLVERRLHEHLGVSSAPVLILGAGEMAHQTLRLIRAADRERPVLVANRTPEKAREMVAGDPNAEALFLEATLAAPPAVGLVVAATSSDRIMLTRAQVEGLRLQLDDNEPLLLVDLAMPPNLDPDARAIRGVDLHGIEEMRGEAEHNRELRLAEIDRCEKLVDHQIETLRRHLLDRALSPAARNLELSFREVADRAVRHSLTKDLSHLDEADRAAVERLARSMVKRLVRVPLRGLKGAAWHHSSAVIDGFLRGLADDLEGEEGEPE
ncbi:MAG: glutamyl-tRNA reductase [Thermoanaerobaculales bacterium]|nr:glutamyl-tRNA reductase [Thermoanaerobaculales bacterium]